MEAKCLTQGKIDIRQADQAMSLKTWWALPFIQPVSRRLVVLVVNHTQITPNQITFAAMIFRAITAVAFFSNSREGLIAGAIFYYLAYVCDCTDGTVARLTGKTSELGRYLDHIADLVGDFLILSVLAWTQSMLLTPMIAGMLFMHLAECYVSYLAGTICRSGISSKSSFPPFNWFNVYRDWWFNRNIKSFFSFPDYTALIFVLFPLLNRPDQGIKIGFIVLLLISLYTIFSTFVSIHTGRKQFP